MELNFGCYMYPQKCMGRALVFKYLVLIIGFSISLWYITDQHTVVAVIDLNLCKPNRLTIAPPSTKKKKTCKRGHGTTH